MIQETHGGDLAEAKVVALLSDYSPVIGETHLGLGSDRRRLLQLPKISASRKDANAPLYRFEGSHVEINRSKVLATHYRDLSEALLGLHPVLELFRLPRRGGGGVRDRIRVHSHMTPELFKAWRDELFDSLGICLSNAKERPDRLPFALWLGLRRYDNSLRSIPVEISEGDLIDSESRNPVDVGVTLGENPRILLPPVSKSEWRPSDEPEATDLLIFHESSHVLMSATYRYDADYRAAAALFRFCRGYLFTGQD